MKQRPFRYTYRGLLARLRVLHHELWMRVLASCFLLGLPAIHSLVPPQGQSQVNRADWRPPLRLAASAGFSSHPTIIGGPDGRLHVFWIENPTPERRPDQSEAIFYVYWDGQQWSEPVDVLVAPSGGVITDLAVALDKRNRFHLLLVDGYGGEVYYTSVDLAEAFLPRSWTVPSKLLYDRVSAMTVQYAAGKLYLAYAQAEEPFFIYTMRSDDYGESWSRPSRVPTTSVLMVPQGLTLAVAQEDVLHITWWEGPWPDRFPPGGVLYARSLDGGLTWDPPFQIREGQYGNPALAVGLEEELFLTYNGAVGVQGRYFRWSSDRGSNWSDEVTIAPQVGGLTGGSMAVDSAGILHYASASHTGEINGIAYARWDGVQWSPLIDLANTPPGTDLRIRQGWEPSMVVTEGNHLHVVYLGAGHGDVFYVTAHSMAPLMVPQAVPAPPSLAPTTEPTPAETGTPEPTSSPSTVTLGIDPPEVRESSFSSGISFLFGVVPVIVFLGAVVLVYLGRLRR